MKRLQLVEIEDLAWYPDKMRQGQTDFLRWMMGTFEVFDKVWPRLYSVYQKSNQQRFVDLCSGGGGAVLQWRAYLKSRGEEDIEILLTDLYPNPLAFKHLNSITQGECRGWEEPVDASDLPSNTEGFLTIFNAFHHFAPNKAEEILRSAVRRGLPIAILEPNDRSLWQLVVNTVSIPVLQFLVSPFIRPFRWSRLVFTYLLPVIPIVTLWDGWVSVFRTYTPAEMEGMTRRADPDAQFDWHIGRARHPFGYVNYVLGIPAGG